MTHREPTGVYRLSRAPRTDRKDWSTGLLQDASAFANALDAIDEDVPAHWTTGVDEQPRYAEPVSASRPPLYTIECHTCEDGDMGGTTDYRDARSAKRAHESREPRHRVYLYEDGNVCA